MGAGRIAGFTGYRKGIMDQYDGVAAMIRFIYLHINRIEKYIF